MLLLVAAIQILFNLYATSMVTAAAVDAARTVAGHDAALDRCGAIVAAETRLLDDLGSYSERGELTLDWVCNDSDVVQLRVRARHPSILPAVLQGLSGLGSIDRTVEVRVERDQ